MPKASYAFDDHHPHPEIILVGQPNCGKSTIFNYVAGYRSLTTNFPGVTVEYTRSHVAVGGRKCNLVDLPGIYSLVVLDQAAEESKKYLLEQKIDVLINVVDASVLSRSLELTLQLLELDVPMVLCLNMMDEARRKGIVIDTERLSRTLHIPVVAAVAAKGQGLEELFTSAFTTLQQPTPIVPLRLSRHVEEKIQEIQQQINVSLRVGVNSRLLTVKLLEEDVYFEKRYPLDESVRQRIDAVKSELMDEHGDSTSAVIAAERHHLAMKIFEQVAVVTQPRRTWSSWLDSLLMHPFLGYALMLIILLAYFSGIFKLGAWVEGPLMNLLTLGIDSAMVLFGADGLSAQLIQAALQGIAGGIAIVLPYLFPFLIGMAFIEDVGYLPRIAFLMDSFMHKIGLHGVAVVPGMLGYGCSVPAIMATRILSTPRDRFIASVIAVLVPCSARMVVIMGLVGYYLGGLAAFGIYLLNLVVVALLGAVLSRLMPEDSPGMILEMPAYHLPKLLVILSKTWLRLKDFIIIAWPLLIVGSMVLGLISWFHLDPFVNLLTRPITAVLNLPEETGMTMIFGILRKELSLLMLFQALGTQDVISVMTKTQILTFTLFVVFYIPCLATLGIMTKEIGWKKTAAAAGVTFLLALIIALLGRLFGFIFLI